MLHITNGDSAAELIQEAVFSGSIMAWRDVLHEGAVPSGFSLQQLSRIRAEWMASQGWGDLELIAQSFAERDKMLMSFREHDEIVLWFEHDLYDQLQLIQILDWFYERHREATKLSLICIGEFTGINPFHGLGQLNTQQMASLFPLRHAVTRKEIFTAHYAWQSFTSANALDLNDLLENDLKPLPFLHASLRRHCEQYPSTFNGLSRTEQQILSAVANAQRTPSQIFQSDQAQEEAVFMGDSTLWLYVKRLCEGATPLLETQSGKPFEVPEELSKEFFSQNLTLTEAGKSVLAGRSDNIHLNGVDRWLGGVHLQGEQAEWRWNGKAIVASNLNQFNSL
jgi:hypothetical protein